MAYKVKGLIKFVILLSECSSARLKSHGYMRVITVLDKPLTLLQYNANYIQNLDYNSLCTKLPRHFEDWKIYRLAR